MKSGQRLGQRKARHESKLDAQLVLEASASSRMPPLQGRFVFQVQAYAVVHFVSALTWAFALLPGEVAFY